MSGLSLAPIPPPPTAAALTILSPGLPSPTSASTAPSTAKSSVFSSADSILSTTPPSPLCNPASGPKPSKSKRKRNHGQGTRETQEGTKRRRVMGRPKNGWTATRLRKLTRLYLMTNLEVSEIAKVLHEKDFTPKQRDVNTQLSLILQPWPKKVRLGAHVTQTRLHVLRECRDLRRNRRGLHPKRKSQNAPEHAESGTLDGASHIRVPISPENLNSSISTHAPQDRPSTVTRVVQEDSEKPLFVESVSWSAELTNVALPTPLLGSGLDPQIERELPTILDYNSKNEEWPFWNFELRPEDLSINLPLPPTALPTQIVGSSPSEIQWLLWDDASDLVSNDYQHIDLDIEQHSQRDGSRFRLLNSSSNSRLCHSPLPQIAEELPVDFDDSPSHHDWPLPNSAMESTAVDVPLLYSKLTPTTPTTAPIRRPERPSTAGNFSEAVQFSLDDDPAPLTSEPIFTSRDLPLGINTTLTNEPKTEGSLFNGVEPSRARSLGIAVLNERLLCKYSDSTLEDINSILERFTISGSSKSFISTTNQSGRSSKLSSYSEMSTSGVPRTLPMLGIHPTFPSEPMKPSITLPGAFHLFCWSQIVNESRLTRCRRDGLLCQHECPTKKFFLSQPMELYSLSKRQIMYRRIISPKINELDMFGNSILHVAASLCSPIRYLMELITKGTDVNATNAAGQTFLHLVHAPTEGNEICELLGMLSVRGFKFGHHDHHGQTSLHNLTRPWLPQQYLITVLRKLTSLGFVLPTTRDNLGLTLLDQMKYLGSQRLGFDPDATMEYRRALGLTCETKGYILRPQYLKSSTNSKFQGNDCVRSYDIHHHIETLDDLQRYAYHADLLKTIGQAGEVSWFEDPCGRSGLHCLAEVDFILPIPEAPSTEADFPELQSSNVGVMRERYLDHLLEAGVNPNNYDKDGYTPLMAFVVHSHASEDDYTTTRILTKLCDGGADVNMRNRRGETALHLSVKLGRRAATKFLLSHGANVHARAKGKLGVVQIGWDASEKAREDEKLYSQIILCILLAVGAGAKSQPTVLQEWAS